MQNKKMFLLGTVFCGLMMVFGGAFAADDIVVEEEVIVEDVDLEQVSADAVANYDVSGSLFQQITDLEQEKILMQLEKERAQLDLELDRLAAEKIKLHMEIDTLSGRQEQQQQEIETQKAKLEAEAARIEKEKESWLAEAEKKATARVASDKRPTEDGAEPEIDITKKYRLVNVIGAGSQLQATIEDLNTGQSKRISVGRDIDGLVVKSISLYDGVVFVGSDGMTQNLNVSGGR
ncbi:MAG: hypothetical protein R8M37_04165 [Alphaproteobacteria bacterium]|nr:hypothetical protein [Alphaproteobacteria bacterium]